MIVVVFRSRLKEGMADALNALGAEMYALASAMPGFLSYKDFAAEDGEFITIIEFETLEQVNDWRDHPEHRMAQKRGQTEFFQEYIIQVSEVIRTLKNP
jgi:heme-degrading monooxygenase HmoA